MKTLSAHYGDGTSNARNVYTDHTKIQADCYLSNFFFFQKYYQTFSQNICSLRETQDILYLLLVCHFLCYSFSSCHEGWLLHFYWWSELNTWNKMKMKWTFSWLKSDSSSGAINDKLGNFNNRLEKW